MNFTLFIAFLLSFSSFLKDLLETRNLRVDQSRSFTKISIGWDNKLLFSIIPSILSAIPLVVNLVVFLKSDKNKFKTIKFNFLKLVLNDYFDSYYFGLVLKGKQIFCNAAIFGECRTIGGETVAFVGQHSPANKFSDNDSITDYLRNFQGFCYSITRRSRFLLETMVDRYCFEGHVKDRMFETLNSAGCSFLKLANIMTLEELDDVDIENLKFSISFLETRIKIEVHDVNNPEDKFERIITEHCLIGEILEIFLNFDFEIDKFGQCYRDSWVIGELSVLLDWSKNIYIGHGSGVPHHIGSLNTNWACTEFLLIFNHWCKSPENGVIYDVNYSSFNKRRGTNILHCLSVFDIIDLLNSGACFKKLILPQGRYLIEGSEGPICSVEKSLAVLQNEVISRVLGPINSQTLNSLCDLYFKKDRDLEKVNFQIGLLKLNCQLYLTNRFVEHTGNYKMKKLLVDCDYFLRMINYGPITGIQKSLNVSRQAVKICMNHQKMEPTAVQKKSVKEVFEDASKGMKKAETKKFLIRRGLDSCASKEAKNQLTNVLSMKKLSKNKDVSCLLEDNERVRNIRFNQISKSYMEALTGEIETVEHKSETDASYALIKLSILEMFRLGHKTESEVIDHVKKKKEEGKSTRRKDKMKESSDKYVSRQLKKWEKVNKSLLDPSKPYNRILKIKKKLRKIEDEKGPDLENSLMCYNMFSVLLKKKSFFRESGDIDPKFFKDSQNPSRVELRSAELNSMLISRQKSEGKKTEDEKESLIVRICLEKKKREDLKAKKKIEEQNRIIELERKELETKRLLEEARLRTMRRELLEESAEDNKVVKARDKVLSKLRELGSETKYETLKDTPDKKIRAVFKKDIGDNLRTNLINDKVFFQLMRPFIVDPKLIKSPYFRELLKSIDDVSLRNKLICFRSVSSG